MKNAEVSLSVIIPTHNETPLGILKDNLELLKSIPHTEILCVDFNSTDGTLELLQFFSVKCISSNHSSRAGRMNEGWQQSQGNWVLFHHPRSRLDKEGLLHLSSQAPQALWGGFTHSFDHTHLLLRWTSWYSNRVRAARGVLYLDHCIFASRMLLESLGKEPFPRVDIFEDTLLSYRLRKFSSPVLLPFESKTSAIRFIKKGIYRQAAINQILKWGFYLRFSLGKMNSFYEAGLDLNGPKGSDF